MHNARMNNMSVSVVVLLGLVALAQTPAQARPRDEVLSGAFRCAAIGGNRTWLDCYYGAAQPERAMLGLQSAPESQLRLVTQPPAGTPSAADQALRDQVLAGATRCSGFEDDHRWLACYYAAAQPARAGLGLPGAARAPAPPPLQAAMAAPGAAVPFGRQERPASPMGGADRISAHMASYSFDKLGWFTVTLDNGQTWRQIHGDTDYAHWKKPAAQYLVLVTHGFLGSFNLQVHGEAKLFKVRRIR
jgi:hypothetical protein